MFLVIAVENQAVTQKNSPMMPVSLIEIFCILDEFCK